MIVLTMFCAAMTHIKGVTETSRTVRLETPRTQRRRPRDARGMDCLYITRYLYNDSRPNFGPHTTGSVKGGRGDYCMCISLLPTT